MMTFCIKIISRCFLNMRCTYVSIQMVLKEKY